MDKLDPRLRRLMRREARPRELAERVGVSFEAEAVGTPAQVQVLVRCTDVGAVSAIQRAGMSVRAMTPGPHMVLSGVVPLDALDRVASIPGVECVEASRRMVPDLDLSRAETRALFLHNIYWLTGAGVVVGVIDTGIDYTHPDFLHTDGSSRILYLWDQSAPASAYGDVPYGHLYTKADLDAALYNGIPLRGDPDAHGTHVTGIAAGNGQASYGVFTGIAPEADIIVVATPPPSSPESDLVSVRVFDASIFIIERAKSIGRPVAINLSLGWNSGGHSGETVLETGLNNLARQPGVVIVKAAGNEQALRIHAGGRIAQGERIDLELLVEDNNSLDDILELWYDDEDKISVSVQPPGSPPLDFVAPGTGKQFQTPAGNNVHVVSDIDVGGAGDTLAHITLTRGGTEFIQPGTWKLRLRADTIHVGGAL
jgi:hypothetical protein